MSRTLHYVGERTPGAARSTACKRDAAGCLATAVVGAVTCRACLRAMGWAVKAKA